MKQGERGTRRSRLASSVGGLTTFGRLGGDAMTSAARAGSARCLDARLTADNHLDRVSDPVDRARRLRALRSAHFRSLALKRTRRP
jgi:hypothetical protein